LYFKNKTRGFIHQKINQINQKMSTLVSILLAVVMEFLAPATISSSEVRHNINRIEVEEVLFFMEELPTVTQFKNC
jgi:hypothetical protein